jgi:hypothetical protein
MFRCLKTAIERLKCMLSGQSQIHDMPVVLAEFLTYAFWKYIHLERNGDVRALMDNEGMRRTIQKALEWSHVLLKMNSYAIEVVHERIL